MLRGERRAPAAALALAAEAGERGQADRDRRCDRDENHGYGRDRNDQNEGKQTGELAENAPRSAAVKAGRWDAGLKFVRHLRHIFTSAFADTDKCNHCAPRQSSPNGCVLTHHTWL